MKYRYRVVKQIVSGIESVLNKFGKDGWDVVGCQFDDSLTIVMVVMKRVIDDEVPKMPQ